MISEFIDLLSKVHLGGVVEECLLSVKDNVGSIEAVDMTNSVFIRCQKELEGLEDSKLGIGDLSILFKFLKSVGKDEEDISIKIESERMIITRKKHGRLIFLLSEPDIIPTVPTGKKVYKKLMGTAELSYRISKRFRNDFNHYYGQLKPKVVGIHMDENGIVLTGGTRKDHQFRISKGSKVDEGLTGNFFAEHLAPIMNVLDMEEQSITFHMSSGGPLIITEGEETMWALNPITGSGNRQDDEEE